MRSLSVCVALVALPAIQAFAFAPLHPRAQPSKVLTPSRSVSFL